MGMADADAESVDEGVPATSVTPLEKEAAPDSTIIVDQCHVGEDVEGGTKAPRDNQDETVAAKLTLDPLRESDNTPLRKKLGRMQLSTQACRTTPYSSLESLAI